MADVAIGAFLLLIWAIAIITDDTPMSILAATLSYLMWR